MTVHSIQRAGTACRRVHVNGAHFPSRCVAGMPLDVLPFLCLCILLLLLPSCTLLSVYAATTCSISPPAHGGMGSCSYTLASTGSCSFICDSGYVLSSTPTSTTCSGLQTCAPCTAGNYWSISAAVLQKYTPPTTSYSGTPNFGFSAAMDCNGS
jgi:hypothetical protein